MFPPLFLSLGWMTNHFGHTYRDKNIQKKLFYQLKMKLF